MAQHGYTYTNHTLGHQSSIDHFIISRNVFDVLTDACIIFDPTNPSSHNVIQLTFKCLDNELPLGYVELKSEQVRKCAWDKATPVQIENYRQMLESDLSAIKLNSSLINCNDITCKLPEHLHSIDDLCATIIDCCLETGYGSIPLIQNKNNSIPGWSEHAKLEKEQSLFWHWVWLEAGKPYNGILYEIMKRTRHKYHYTVRRIKKNKMNLQKEKLTEHLYDSNVFWRSLKNINPVNKTLPNVVDNKNGSHEINKLFVQKYKTLYTSAPTNDTELNDINHQIDSRLHCGLYENEWVTPSIIGKCIALLNKNKMDGDKGFSSNHLIYAGRRLHVYLSMLFNAMLSHGYYPNELLKSTIISIPKDRTASLSNSDNYRGISLFNCLCKLFDYVIIQLSGESLITSDMQFGFKPQHSTTMCTVILREVVSHFIEGNSNVYCCLLDASKAFDKIHYGKLFKILLSKHFPPVVLRLLLNSYIRQSARVLWNNCMSSYFVLSNGVKQGGVLSPRLFTLYIDDLLVMLKESGYGCHINDIFIGALSYADDITLLCPSLGGLNKMIEICSLYANDFNITFNSKKTLCMKFGDQLKPCEIAKLNGCKISWVDNIRHLGNYLDTTMTDEIDCRAKTSAFIGYVNKCIVNFGHLQFDVLCTLFKSYCCSYYGCQMWRLDSLYFNKVCTSWNRGVRKVFNLSNTTHRWLLGPLLNQQHINCQLYKRCLRFLYSMNNCCNGIVQTCFNQSVDNANTPLGCNIAFFRNKYGKDITSCSLNNCLQVMRSLKLSVQQSILFDNLKTLLYAREGSHVIEGFTFHDIDNLIRLISTE